MKIWAKLDSYHFVQYRSVWREKCHQGILDNFKQAQANLGIETLVNPNQVMSPKCYVIYFQMDLCWFDLCVALEKCQNHFNVGSNNPYPILCYYILSEILLEVFEAIDYLHKYEPPIIHRDIKPQNVLIKGDRLTGRFVKLADFGLAVAHESGSQSHSQNTGTVNYIAPEVIKSRIYTTTADLYSLGVMIQHMFNINFNKLS